MDAPRMLWCRVVSVSAGRCTSNGRRHLPRTFRACTFLVQPGFDEAGMRSGRRRPSTPLDEEGSSIEME